MKALQIDYNNATVPIERIDDDTFCVHLPDNDLRIQYQPDNEGADHWIDLNSNKETEQTIKLGEQLAAFLEK
jgi:hypothetical protein